MYNMKMKLLMRILLLCFWFQLSFSQNATTDPSEVRALNSIFEQWDTKAVQGQWNISGEPCSGSAINGTNIESPDINPALVCNCSYDNNATCHITKLSVYSPKKRGVFPEEFVALRYLTFLEIRYNYFTGPLPAFIGNMSALTELSIASNSFSGPIPKELGNLKELTVLKIDYNDFTGPLPAFIGNMSALTELSIASNSFSGPIPKELGNLKELIVLDIRSNNFSGTLPPELGNLVKLENLIIIETGQKLTSNITDIVSNLVITTCTVRQVCGLSQKASTLIGVGFGYLNSSFFISLADVGFQQKYGDVVRLRVNDYTSFQFL